MRNFRSPDWPHWFTDTPNLVFYFFTRMSYCKPAFHSFRNFVTDLIAMLISISPRADGFDIQKPTCRRLFVQLFFFKFSFAETKPRTEMKASRFNSAFFSVPSEIRDKGCPRSDLQLWALKFKSGQVELLCSSLPFGARYILGCRVSANSSKITAPSCYRVSQQWPFCGQNGKISSSYSMGICKNFPMAVRNLVQQCLWKPNSVQN